jgi:membrane protein DedA with SNARE-associated domain
MSGAARSRRLSGATRRTLFTRMPLDLLPSLLVSWGCPALLVLLLLTGVGSPVPEDFLLLAAGYLLGAGVLDWRLGGVIAWLGVVGSDVMLYAAGRRLARHATHWHDEHLLSLARMRRATRWFERCGNLLILVARLMPGTRAIVFVTAGVRGVPPKTFLAYDGLGALLWVPAMLAVGHAAGQHVGGFDTLAGLLDRGAAWLFVALAVLVLAWLLMGRQHASP